MPREPPNPSLPAFPSRVSVEVTNHCDQRCRLCPRESFTRALGFIDPEIFVRVAEECARHDTALWLHFLGEPLLHRNLVEMIRVAKSAGVARVGLSTNATKLEGAIVDALIDSGLDRLECSMDADDRDGYRSMRGRDDFDRVRRNVRAFLARKHERGARLPVTSVQFMRTPELEASLDSILTAWRPHLLGDDFLMTIVPATFGGSIPVPLEGDDRRPPCAWLFSSIVILQDGTVTMCGADWDAQAPLGSVARSTISEIWNGEEVARRRRAHLEGRFGDVGPCGECRDWRLADGHGYTNALRDAAERGPA